MASSLLLKLPVAVRGAAKILGVTRVKNMLEKGVSQAEIKRMAQNTDRSIPSGISSKARKNLGGGNISSLVNKLKSLDNRLWGIYGVIIGVAFIEKFL